LFNFTRLCVLRTISLAVCNFTRLCMLRTASLTVCNTAVASRQNSSCIRKACCLLHQSGCCNKQTCTTQVYKITAQAAPHRHPRNFLKDQFSVARHALAMRLALLLVVLGYFIHCCDAINKLYLASYPLVGGPPFLKLHVAIVHESNAAIMTQFDFLPANLTAAATAFRLLTLQSSPGELRERQLRYRPKNLQYICDTSASVQDLRAFTAAYDDQLHLLNNSCSTFADRLIDKCRADEK
jgi:hypothetical protein